MKFGYADNTVDVLQDVDQMFYDDVSCNKKHRTNLNLCVSMLQAGDTLVVRSLGQLSWSIKNVVTLLLNLFAKDVNVYVTELNLNMRDFASIIKDFNNCNMRQFEKIATLGRTRHKRKKIIIDKELWNAYYMLYKKNEIKKPDIARKLNLSFPTFYRRFKEYEASLVK